MNTNFRGSTIQMMGAPVLHRKRGRELGRRRRGEAVEKNEGDAEPAPIHGLRYSLRKKIRQLCIDERRNPNA